MKKMRFIAFWLLTALLFSSNVYSQQSKFKALILYNITKYIEWPNIKNQEFIITVVNNKSLSNELRTIAKTKGIGNSKLVVKDVSDLNSVTDCQIIYVSSKNSEELKHCLEKSKNKNILVVTEMDNGCKQGAGINIISKSGRINFEVSRKNIVSKGLTLSSQLISLGIEII